MYQVSFGLPKNEWQRIIATLRQTWPDERISDEELARRCVILGVRTLPYLSPESARQFVAIYRSYQPPFDGHGERRLLAQGELEGELEGYHP